MLGKKSAQRNNENKMTLSNDIKLRAPSVQKKEVIKKENDIPLPNIYFKDEVETAVVHYANGNIKTATDSLVRRLNSKNGKVNEEEWYMILDSYQSTGKKNDFETLCSLFSYVFKLSPPIWQEYSLYKENNNQELLKIDCDISEIRMTRINYMLENSLNSRYCCIDFSRASIKDDEHDNIIRALAKKMEQIRISNVEVSIIGDSNIIQILKNKIDNLKDERSKAEKNKGYWILLMEIYNWIEDLENFENLSIDFSLLFRESPPTYTTLYKNKLIKDSDKILAPQIIDNQNVYELINQIKLNINKTRIKVNFKEVIRINYQASITLAEFIKEFCENNPKKKIIFIEPIEMIKYLFKMVGISHFVELTARTR